MPVRIHLGAGVFQTAGISRASNFDGSVNNSVYYTFWQVKDWWDIGGASEYGTTIQLLPNSILSPSALGSGTSQSDWFVIGPIYDSQINGPDALHSFIAHDFKIDGNFQNQSIQWGVCVGVTSVSTLYRNINVINCGTGIPVEYFLFTIRSSGPGNGSGGWGGVGYGTFDNCSVSGTVYGTQDDAICFNDEGQASVNLISIIRNCSVTYTGTTPMAMAYCPVGGLNPIGGGTNGAASSLVINNYAYGCKDSVYSDTGYFDNTEVIGNRFFNTNEGVTVSGNYSDNLIVKDNFITLDQGGAAFMFWNPNTNGRITGNTVLLDGTNTVGTFFSNMFSTLAANSFQIDNNTMDSRLTGFANPIAFTGFNNTALTGFPVTALTTTNTILPFQVPLVGASTSAGLSLNYTGSNGIFTISGTPNLSSTATVLGGTAATLSVSGTASIPSWSETLTSGTATFTITGTGSGQQAMFFQTGSENLSRNISSTVPAVATPIMLFLNDNSAVNNSTTQSQIYVKNSFTMGGGGAGHVGITLDKGASNLSACFNFCSVGTSEWDCGISDDLNFHLRDTVHNNKIFNVFQGAPAYSENIFSTGDVVIDGNNATDDGYALQTPSLALTGSSAGAVTLTSGVGTVVNSSFTTSTAMAFPTISSSSGTLSGPPSVIMYSGSAKFIGGAGDNSTYNWRAIH
jgi:hypothetical protein